MASRDAGTGRALDGTSASRRLGMAVLRANSAYVASDVDAGMAAVAVAEHLLRIIDARELSAHAEIVALVALCKGRLLLLAGDADGARASLGVATSAARAPGCDELLSATLVARAAVEASDGRLALASHLVTCAELVAQDAAAGVTPGSVASAVVLAGAGTADRSVVDLRGGNDLPSWLELWLDAADAGLSHARHSAAAVPRAAEMARLEQVDEHPVRGRTVTAPAPVREGEADRLPARSVPRVGPFVEPLTTKETEVLAHLADFLNTEQIAETMYVSVNTVRTHVRSILRKLGVSRRNEAVRRAWDLALLPLPARSPSIR
jgi:LuxR family transcriptional regulator, maltose regulon positive regulatory protein